MSSISAIQNLNKANFSLDQTLINTDNVHQCCWHKCWMMTLTHPKIKTCDVIWSIKVKTFHPQFATQSFNAHIYTNGKRPFVSTETASPSLSSSKIDLYFQTSVVSYLLSLRLLLSKAAECILASPWPTEHVCHPPEWSADGQSYITISVERDPQRDPPSLDLKLLSFWPLTGSTQSWSFFFFFK